MYRMKYQVNEIKLSAIVYFLQLDDVPEVKTKVEDASGKLMKFHLIL